MKRLIGVAIFISIIGGALVYQFLIKGTSSSAVTIKGLVSGDKVQFLENKKVKDILRKKYGIIIEYTKADSMDAMKDADPDDASFLWPSSQVTLEALKQKQPAKIIKSDIVFSSPLVFYSWDVVVDALVKQKIVTKRGSVYYISDFKKLINLIVKGDSWKSIGLKDLFGKITIMSTNPSVSDSGAMFSGLMATVLKGDVVSDKSLVEVLPAIKDYFQRVGQMERSTSDLFKQYLQTGVGAKPIIVGYENQIIEFSLNNKEKWPLIEKKVRVLYPSPTMWSSHSIIIIDENAKSLLAALKDKKIQQIAWKSHGFRIGLIGIQKNPISLNIKGIPNGITKVVSLPSYSVMNKIIISLQGKKQTYDDIKNDLQDIDENKKIKEPKIRVRKVEPKRSSRKVESKSSSGSSSSSSSGGW